MNEQCPISEATVGEKAARVVAALTAVAALAYLLAQPVALLALLVYEFLARGVLGGGSALAWLARAVVRRGGDRQVNAAPKVFAARLGLGMSVLALGLHLGGLLLAASGVMAVLLLCAVLEAAFAYCVGCQVYGLLLRLRR